MPHAVQRQHIAHVTPCDMSGLNGRRVRKALLKGQVACASAKELSGNRAKPQLLVYAFGERRGGREVEIAASRGIKIVAQHATQGGGDALAAMRGLGCHARHDSYSGMLFAPANPCRGDQFIVHSSAINAAGQGIRPSAPNNGRQERLQKEAVGMIGYCVADARGQGRLQTFDCQIHSRRKENLLHVDMLRGWSRGRPTYLRMVH